MAASIADLESLFRKNKEGFENFLPHQLSALETWEREGWDRALVFYPTGKAKTTIMLSMVAMRGYEEAVVLAPPITHNKWLADGAAIGIKVIALSHAKFRQPDVRVRRNCPIIVDEFHLLGGQSKAGFTKLDKLAPGLQAPLILGSATPNYNDAERCYCLVHVLNPLDHRGGFIAWLYEHCNTAPNPYGVTPLVREDQPFKLYKNAEEFLVNQPNVIYLPDEAPDILLDYEVNVSGLPDEFYDLGLDRPQQRVMASIMERKQRESLYEILDQDSMELSLDVMESLSILDEQLGETPRLIFAQRSTVAQAILRSYEAAAEPGDWYFSTGYIDGSMTTKQKLEISEAWVRGEFRVLIGTASLATGADGMDKVCNHLIIVDDTEDNSLRRQLVGRILPRGDVKPEDYVGKVAYRFKYVVRP